MARPKKTGLDYFPFDCDFFEDEKIVSIGGEFGIKGELATIKLLCAIYRNGYFIEWSDMLRYKLLRQLPTVSAELLDQILNRLVRWGFFDASLFDSVKVLTSVGIQRRYFSIIRKRVGSEKYPFLLVSASETPVSASETPVSASETPQSKGKKSKEKKSLIRDKKKDGVIPGLEEPKKSRPSKPKREFEIPTLTQVLDYFKENFRGSDEWELEAKLFYSHFDSLGWKNALGTPVERWDSKANNWILNHIKSTKNEQTNTNGAYPPGSGIPIRGRIEPACGLKGRHKRRET